MPAPNYEAMREPVTEIGDEKPEEFNEGEGKVVNLDDFRKTVEKTRKNVSRAVDASASARAQRQLSDREAAEMHRAAIANAKIRGDEKIRGASDYFPGGFKVDAATGAENLMTRAQMNRDSEKNKKGGFLSKIFRRPQ